VPINFIPNDPRAGSKAPPLREKKPHRNRPAGRAGFTFHDREPERLHAPGTPGFLFWQCREAALLAVAAWERHAGPLGRWAEGRRRLHLHQDAVAQLDEAPDLNAYYDRDGFIFFEYDDGEKKTFSGASTDVVAHEVGHGLLDAIRPDLWDTPFLEVNAFHEAFGDCMAIVTALGDARTRTALLRVGLGARNFVEATAEDLADGIRRVDPEHNAAAPRRALNKLQWQLPSSLPRDGGPGELINESHSFAQVFTGCFWDLIRNLLGAGKTGDALEAAARTAAGLLIEGAKAAPEQARFFQAVGRAMALGDGERHGGANHLAIRDAFGAHGVALGSNAMLAPMAALAGPSPRVTKVAATLSPSTRRDVMDRLGMSGHARMVMRRYEIAGESVVQAVHRRDIALGDVTPKLRGVVAVAPETVLVGESGGRAAVLGGLPEASVTTDEVMGYVESLVRHERIDYGGKKKGAGAERRLAWRTHSIRSVGGRQVLMRVRFACGGDSVRRGSAL
jgi:hypothetical protein